MMHQFAAVSKAAARASEAALGLLPEVGTLGTELVNKAGHGLFALLAITALSVQPWGRTPYGKRKQQELRQAATDIPDTSAGLALPEPVNGTVSTNLPLGLKIFIAVAVVLLLIFGVKHHGAHSFHHLH